VNVYLSTSNPGNNNPQSEVTKMAALEEMGGNITYLLNEDDFKGSSPAKKYRQSCGLITRIFFYSRIFRQYLIPKKQE
jgi:hypothetical protein